MKSLHNLGIYTALVSFILGTTILILHFYFKTNTSIIIVGLYYTISAIVVNLIVFIILLIGAAINSIYRFKLLKSCAIQLINLPIAALYFYIVIQFSFPEF